MPNSIANFYSGTSGLKLPFPKHSFPDEFKDKSRLAYYALHNNSLEVNSSFYKMPLASTIKKWANEVPNGFCFTFKLFKGITHNKGLEFNPEDVAKFISIIDNAGDKKGALLIQFPPSLTMTAINQLSILLETIKQVNETGHWPVAIEFRNKTWYTDMTYQLLENYGAALVVQDIPASTTPFIETDLDFAYIRFHGPKGDYRGGYAEEVMAEYASYINEWKDKGKTVYAYFNNTIGDALSDLEALRKFVG